MNPTSDTTAPGRAADPGRSTHAVHFYESDHHLVRALASFFREGLAEGAKCIVVATGAHRQALESRLVAMGVPLAMARARGRFVELDASETLGKFLVDEQPDGLLFRETVGALLPKDGPAPYVFGEMVALLWAQGNREGAIRLEELWNEAIRERLVHLMCGYPRNGFDLDSDPGAFARVCASHSRVLVG